MKPAPSSLAARFQRFVDQGVLAGAVMLVAGKDGVLDHGAVGWADIAARAPMKPDSVFWIASISKPITGAALMMLVDEGKVRLDDPVEAHLPEFRGQLMAVEQGEERTVLRPSPRPITVREALSHTSGMPFGSRPEAGKIDTLSLREKAISYALTPLQSAPGEKWAYSNAGTNTAGRIVEVVSGLPYADFLQQRLFAPLGMVDTTFWPDRGQLARLAKTYRARADLGGLEEIPIDQCTYPLDARTRHPSPAGGLFSTAADLALLARMVMRGGELGGRRYLSEAAVAEMTAKQTGSLPHQYGLGWESDPTGGQTGHGGALKTQLRIYRRQALAAIYLVQHGSYGSGEGELIMSAFMAGAIELHGAKAG